MEEPHEMSKEQTLNTESPMGNVAMGNKRKKKKKTREKKNTYWKGNP